MQNRIDQIKNIFNSFSFRKTFSFLVTLVVFFSLGIILGKNLINDPGKIINQVAPSPKTQISNQQTNTIPLNDNQEIDPTDGSLYFTEVNDKGTKDIYLEKDGVVFIEKSRDCLYLDFCDFKKVYGMMDGYHSNWIKLIDKNELEGQEVFSFAVVPGVNTSFLFVLTPKFDSINKEKVNVIYYYQRLAGGNQLRKVTSFDIPVNKPIYTYPKIQKFSNTIDENTGDVRFASALLFGCMGCGGHQPETLLIDLKNLKTKKIGKVSYLQLGEDGNYEYKDYVPVDCPQPGIASGCSQDPASLPLKNGKFED